MVIALLNAQRETVVDLHQLNRTNSQQSEQCMIGANILIVSALLLYQRILLVNLRDQHVTNSERHTQPAHLFLDLFQIQLQLPRLGALVDQLLTGLHQAAVNVFDLDAVQ